MHAQAIDVDGAIAANRTTIGSASDADVLNGTNWFLVGTEVVGVGDFVLESDGSGFVHFEDGDRLNLRRKNLSIQRHREQGRVVRRPAKGLFGRQKRASEKSSSDVVGRSRPFPAAAPIARPPANPVRMAVPTVKRRVLTR